MTRRTTHLTALAATLLAVAVAAGVSTPRLRTGGRERAARGAALAGSTRPDQPCAWIEPDDDFAFEAAPAGDLVAEALAPAHGAAQPFEAPVGPVPAARPAAVIAAILGGPLAHDLPARRPTTTRGPPARLS